MLKALTYIYIPMMSSKGLKPPERKQFLRGSEGADPED